MEFWRRARDSRSQGGRHVLELRDGLPAFDFAVNPQPGVEDNQGDADGPAEKLSDTKKLPRFHLRSPGLVITLLSDRKPKC